MVLKEKNNRRCNMHLVVAAVLVIIAFIVWIVETM
jgi:hypothetical protein